MFFLHSATSNKNNKLVAEHFLVFFKVVKKSEKGNADTDTWAGVRLILNLIYVYTTGLKKENLMEKMLILTQSFELLEN